MLWWYWMLGGLGLLVIEVLAPGGFIALFFGVGAILVGALVRFGIIETPWLQWVLFSVISVLALFVLRRPLQARLNLRNRQGPVDSIVGTEAIVTKEVPVGGTGAAELRGATWTARTRGNTPLAVGKRARVEEMDGLTLWLKAD